MMFARLVRGRAKGIFFVNENRGRMPERCFQPMWQDHDDDNSEKNQVTLGFRVPAFTIGLREPGYQVKLLYFTKISIIESSKLLVN